MNFMNFFTLPCITRCTPKLRRFINNNSISNSSKSIHCTKTGASIKKWAVLQVNLNNFVDFVDLAFTQVLKPARLHIIWKPKVSLSLGMFSYFVKWSSIENIPNGYFKKLKTKKRKLVMDSKYSILKDSFKGIWIQLSKCSHQSVYVSRNCLLFCCLRNLTSKCSYNQGDF